jgi:pimeloyl-ACP methyl ester carboxylesterase
MRLSVQGGDAYVYTGTKAWSSIQPWVLFIHGAANDHSVWALQSRYFAHHGWNVVAPDLPGHGQSAGAPLQSIEAIAQWCNALLTASCNTCGATQESRCAIVGHSMGSLAALALAAERGARCSHLALLGCAAPMGVSDSLRDAARDDTDRAYRMIVQWAFSPTSHIGGNQLPGVSMTGQSLALMRRSAPGVLHQDLSNCKDFAEKGVACASRVSGKVLVLSANKDLMTPVKAVAPVIDTFRSNAAVALKHETLMGCGHSMMSERPEAVLLALRGLLNS